MEEFKIEKAGDSQGIKYNFLKFIIFVLIVALIIFIAGFLPKKVLDSQNFIFWLGVGSLTFSGIITYIINDKLLSKLKLRAKLQLEIVSYFANLVIFGYLILKIYPVLKDPGIDLAAYPLLLLELVSICGFLFSLYNFFKKLYNFKKTLNTNI